MAGYADEVDVEGTAFKFEDVGDEIYGEVISLAAKKGKFGEQLVLVVREEVSGEPHTVYAGQAVLKRKLQELSLRPKDEIDIKYDGQNEKRVKLFKVAAKRDGQRLMPSIAVAYGDSDSSMASAQDVEDAFVKDNGVPF